MLNIAEMKKKENPMFAYRYIIVFALVALVLGGCTRVQNYFDVSQYWPSGSDDGEVLAVSSKDLPQDFMMSAPKDGVRDFRQDVYHGSDGAVELFDLDQAPAAARQQYEMNHGVSPDRRGLEISPSVEIYPIDTGMQQVLKPGS